MWLIEKGGEKCIISDYELSYKCNKDTKLITRIPFKLSGSFAGIPTTKRKIKDIVIYYKNLAEKSKIKRKKYLEIIRKLKEM